MSNTTAREAAGKAAFRRALAFTLRDDIEGGWYDGSGSHDPNPTMRGVTQRTYDAWRVSFGLPKQTVRNIRQDEIEGIYLRDYWTAAGCHLLAGGCVTAVAAAAHFEAAVNCGVGTAVRLLQRAVRVDADGIIGPITRAAVSCFLSFPDGDEELAEALLWERLRYYRDLARQPRLRPNLLAWTDRIVKFKQVFIDGGGPEV